MPVSQTGATDLSRSGRDRPLVSMEGWARFEQRARQRRIEHRLQAARAAILSRQWAAARAALDELKELEPNLPELDALTLQITRARTGGRRSHRGAFVLAAAAAFATVLFAASWFENTGRLPSSPKAEPAPVAPAPEPLLASRDITIDLGALALDLPVATAGNAVTEVVLSDTEVIDPPPVPVTPRASDPASRPARTPPSAASSPAAVPPSAAASPSAPAPLTPSGSVASQLDLPPAPAPEPVVTQPVAPAARPQVSPSPGVVARDVVPAAVPSAAARDGVPTAGSVDDDAQVKAVLQKYRAAYERLDAASVHAVWPGVNEAALSRAFGGLESQALDFKACYIQLRGATADVLCTGSSRYVPKVGSREPRVEQLEWNFTLRKKANDWEIETARAER